MDSNSPQSNNPFLSSGQAGSGSSPSSLANTNASGFKSGYTGPGSNSGSNSTAGSTRDPIDVDHKAANDLGSNAAALGNSVVANLQSAANSIVNNPTVQSINNGPVAQNVREQASITQHEFQDLIDSRTRPAQSAATGQPLTYYHSTFYTLLTWKNPRATAIIFASSIAFIFMTRYLNILSYFFKFAYFTLGVTASLEIAGKLLFDNGLASRMRPRKYYTVSKESLAQSLDDMEQLVNFFVIEGQRLLFAENVYATIAVFIAAVISFLFIKVVPFWGLALMATCVLYLGPLIYIKNREAIDSTVDQMEHVISDQATHLRDLTAMHANQASQTVKAYADEFSHTAQEYMGSAKKSVSNTVPAATDSIKSGLDKAESATNDTLNKADSQLKKAENQAQQNLRNTSSTTGSSYSTGAAPYTTGTASGSTYTAGTTSSSTFGSNSSTVPISDFRTAAPPSSTTLGSSDFRSLSSNDFPAVPRRDAELVADSIRPRDSEVQSLLNH